MKLHFYETQKFIGRIGFFFKNQYQISYLILVVFLAGFSEKSKAADNPPNVIFILADDMGHNDLGSYGQKLIQTPNLDRLAEEGMRFSQHYAGSAVCAPSRAVLMTGMHTGHSDIRGNFPFKTEGNLPIPDESVTVAEIFKSKGYTTGMMGKWGLGGPGSVGGPTKQGFDYSLAYLDQRKAHDYYIPYLWENEEKFVIDGNQNGAKGVYSHDLFAEEALKFIRENEKNPFFLYLPFTIPHGEHVIPSNAPYQNEKWSEKQKNYAAMITRLDGDVGKIMSLLKELQLDENTIVFFTSDNGGLPDMIKVFDSNGEFRGNKGDLYEGGIRVPLIVRWPEKIEAGTVSHHVSGFWDFVPTASELIGAKAPENIDGKSYLPTLLGGKQAQHEFLYWEFFNPRTKSDEQGNSHTISVFTQQAVRMGDWKAVRSNLSQNPDAPFELYHLKHDIGETKNVALQNHDIIKKIEYYLAGARYDVEYFKR